MGNEKHSYEGSNMRAGPIPLYDYCGGVDLDEFRELVEVAAYFKAEKRGFIPDHELDDWLEAEQEISQQRRYWS